MSPNSSFRGQINRADEKLGRINNPFLRTGMQMVLDGASNEDIMALLQWRIGRMCARERAKAQIFRTMAAYAYQSKDNTISMVASSGSTQQAQKVDKTPTPQTGPMPTTQTSPGETPTQGQYSAGWQRPDWQGGHTITDQPE